MRPNMVETRLAFGGLDRLGDGFHIDAFPNHFFLSSTGPVSRLRRPNYSSGSKISLNNTLKIRFICRNFGLARASSSFVPLLLVNLLWSLQTRTHARFAMTA